MRRVLAILGTIWALPTTLIGLLVGLTLGFHRLHHWEGLSAVLVPCEICVVYRKQYFGVTLGNVILAGGAAAETAWIMKHERRHTVQAWVLGPLFLPAYGLASLWAVARGGDAYADNWFERDARNHQGPVTH